jgi:hypothetical protein
MQPVSKQSKVRIFAFSARSIAESNGANFKRYYGFNKFKCVAVNPTAAQISKLLGREDVGQEPNYITQVQTGDVVVPQVRIDFWLQSTTNIPMFVRVSYYLVQNAQYDRNKTKVHVIDEFGRDAWPTIEECENHQIPIYKNGPANITNNYKPMFGKEHEFLIGFLKSLLWIPPYQFVKDGQLFTNDPETCKCSLDKVLSYFKGDFSELNELVKMHPENEIWALVGVRKADDGNLYQQVFKEAMTSVRNNNYRTFINKALKDRKEAGAYANVEFFDGPMKEYEVEETTFAEQNNQEAPKPASIDNFFK